MLVIKCMLIICYIPIVFTAVCKNNIQYMILMDCTDVLQNCADVSAN